MHRALLTTAALTLAATVTPLGQGTSTPDFSADRVKAHVTFLADDLLEGREAGTRGHEIAARYVATQFALLGVKPGAADGSYYLPVDLAELTRAGTPTFTLKTSRGSRSLKHGEDVIVSGSGVEGTSQAQGDLVFAGFGVADSALGIDDYKGLDVRGKIVVVLAAPLSGIDSEIAAHLYSRQRRTAADHGAVGFISIATRGSEKVFPFERQLQMLHTPGTTLVRKNGATNTSEIKASAIVGPKAAAQLFEGAPKSLTQLLDEADTPGARPAAFALKASAEMRATTSVRRYTSPDVVGLIEGADPVLKNEYVALMGHADHIGIDSKASGDRINNGALDNAAGVATLLEVARAFVTAAERPKRSILIVANTAEEKGLLGAEAFANNPPVPVDRIVAAIDLDMPLLLYDFTDVVAYGGSHSTLDRAFQAAGHQMGVTLSPDPMPEQSIFVRSDHYAMAKVGVPAVMLATGMANGGDKAWAGFLAAQYHHPGDDLHQPINWKAGARFAELNYRAVRILADEKEPPRWYEGDYFGNLFAPKAPKARKP
ncbi:MAG: M28 family metallopeptidase [Vicinamibacterales bacterium]